MTQSTANELMSRAREAQRSINSWSQEQVDRMVAAVGWHAYEEANVREMTRQSFSESGIGVENDTYERHRRRVLGTLRDLLNVRTTGIVDVDCARGLTFLAKPIGVIAAITPVTAPTAAICQNALLALKTRNAMVFCPHPRVRQTAQLVIEKLRVGLRESSAPAHLLQCVEEPTQLNAQELMANADLVLAAGGQGTVDKAYTSGTPAFGGGAGNAVVIVDETADLDDAAFKTYRGKSFDNGTSCSAESSLVIAAEVWESLIDKLCSLGCYRCNDQESVQLSRVMWPAGGRLARAVVGRDAQLIAGLAGITTTAATRVLLVAPMGTGTEEVFSREKLSPVLALWKFREFDEAIRLVQELTSVHGCGHSCGIHSRRRERIERLASKVNVSRVMVNQSTGIGNSGDFGNGMPFTTTLCCGSWGGSITNENITWRHLLNYTWVSDPLDERKPSVDMIFKDHLQMRTGC